MSDARKRLEWAPTLKTCLKCGGVIHVSRTSDGPPPTFRLMCIDCILDKTDDRPPTVLPSRGGMLRPCDEAASQYDGTARKQVEEFVALLRDSERKGCASTSIHGLKQDGLANDIQNILNKTAPGAESAEDSLLAQCATECHETLIDAGIISADTPPMSMGEGVVVYVAGLKKKVNKAESAYVGSEQRIGKAKMALHEANDSLASCDDLLEESRANVQQLSCRVEAYEDGAKMFSKAEMDAVKAKTTRAIDRGNKYYTSYKERWQKREKAEAKHKEALDLCERYIKRLHKTEVEAKALRGAYGEAERRIEDWQERHKALRKRVEAWASDDCCCCHEGKCNCEALFAILRGEAEA